MNATWAVISWSVPSFVPTDYSITDYELGYNVLQSHNCSMVDFESIDIQMNGQFCNVSGTITQISNLMSSTCYVFAVRAYTINGYSKWVYTTNKTLPEKVQTSSYSASTTAISTSAITIPSTTQIISASTLLIEFIPTTTSSTAISTSLIGSTSTTSTSTSSK